jgi:hypothetical protein
MFSGLQVRGGPSNVNKEDSKELDQVADPAYPSSTNVQVEVQDGPAMVG